MGAMRLVPVNLNDTITMAFTAQHTLKMGLRLALEPHKRGHDLEYAMANKRRSEQWWGICK